MIQSSWQAIKEYCLNHGISYNETQNIVESIVRRATKEEIESIPLPELDIPTIIRNYYLAQIDKKYERARPAIYYRKKNKRPDSFGRIKYASIAGRRERVCSGVVLPQGVKRTKEPDLPISIVDLSTLQFIPSN